ncbi:MAG: dihydrolipoyl dehydrogenase [Gammaproteobacteria bacterium]|nr:dihydrolipoyl dehydrogenase [Gammaproteobacteria bacterium]
MANVVEVKVPNIGDFQNVDVIEVLVSAGDRVKPEDSLITLESDKATMEIPSPDAGVVKSLAVSVGDKVSEGATILSLETEETSPEATAPDGETGAPLDSPSSATVNADLHAEVLVLGAGPGGYTAAFRAADLGKSVVLVERYPSLGGVCLNVGCIPSKALLHTAEVVSAAREMADFGVAFGAPQVDLTKLRAWKDGIVGRLTGGLSQLAKRRKVRVLQGEGRFYSANRLILAGEAGEQTISFDQAIIAAGSRVSRIPGFPYEDPRVMDSTDALALADVPRRLLVVGGGIIGLEMATVYESLGSRVTVVELMDNLIPGCDQDLVKPLHKRIAKRYENIFLGTKVTRVQAQKKGLKVNFEGGKAPEAATFDKILVAVGRRPNGDLIGVENAGVFVDDRGFIKVDAQQRTNVANIFAIGDIVGQPMLAHKASHEGKVAAEVVAGRRTAFEALTIPNVAYTDPEVAWMGLSETQAKEQGIDVDKASFPLAASGRALGMGRDEGFTKLLFNKENGRLVGAGVVGPHAGDLIAETVLALEMGADAQDIGLTIHPHPTLSESIGMAAEIAEGTITDLYMPKRR